MNPAIGALQTIETAKFRVGRVVVTGDEATALVDHRVAGVLNGRPKPRKIVDVSTDRDIWIRTPEGCLLKHTECAKERVTIDGKVVTPSPGLPSSPRAAR